METARDGEREKVIIERDTENEIHKHREVRDTHRRRQTQRERDIQRRTHKERDRKRV